MDIGTCRKRKGLGARIRRGAGRLALGASAAAALAGSAAAQATGAISGRITERGSAPVAGAQVAVDAGARGTLSNDVGTFRLANVPAGPHSLTVERIGFTTYEANVIVAAGE